MLTDAYPGMCTDMCTNMCIDVWLGTELLLCIMERGLGFLGAPCGTIGTRPSADSFSSSSEHAVGERRRLRPDLKGRHGEESGRVARLETFQIGTGRRCSPSACSGMC